MNVPEKAIPQGVCTQDFQFASIIRCNLGTIDPDFVPTTIHIQVTAPLTVSASLPVLPGEITNTVTVTADQPDPVPANNEATAVTIVVPMADLTITKSDFPDPVPLGELLTYTLIITNTGPNDAANVSLFETLPTFVTLQTVTAPAGWTCTPGTANCSIGVLPVFS